MTDLPKTFEPAAIEAKWYAHWEASGLFRPERPDAVPFTIVNPPPNVTGSLHIGHALDNTLQDIVIRYERLRGKDALWVVGTDHAGIATQMVVERQMNARGEKRTDYSREAFIDKVWEWKAESGGTITGQLRRLGCSMDWSREQFTMDPHFTRAVVKVFVDLYNEGLIYRDKRLVNWDPGLKTAISDLEVETREVQGHFWHFRYPLADGATLANGQDFIEVATTRPETMLADMAVAVHPEDERYAGVVGGHVVLPITGRRIPIVADEHADPALGTGAVKITPGHDFNDFEVGRRAGIAAGDMLNMLDADAHVCQTADGLIPDAYLGLERFEARKAVVAALKASGHLVLQQQKRKTKDGEEEIVELEAEPRTIQTPYGDRSGVVIEPWLTDQWYVDAATLAKPAIEAVRSGAIEIVPKSWEKTYFNWMENIQPWCVSRQLWWGHRIPAWYGQRKDGDNLYGHFTPLLESGSKRAIFVAYSAEEALEQAQRYYGEGYSPYLDLENDNEFTELHLIEEGQSRPVRIHQDPDVLDTWFSSALWPFATLGWPDTPPPFGSSEVENRSRDGVSTALDTNGGGADNATSARHAELVSASTDQSSATSAAPWTLKHVQGDGKGGRDGDGREQSLVARHYPNDLLISGFDILFFWDARMAMQGIHLMGDVPWRRLYLHGLVRAADGQKMSKSKGNVVDPLGLIDRYGADALRFFMAAMESQGRDVKMDEKRVEGYRNFATKLWNATRFAMSNGIGASASVAAPAAALPVNRWIIGEVVETVAALDKAMAELRFDAAANAIYHFVWDRFCDWYLELIKPLFAEGADAAGAAETRAVAGWVLDQILVMLHPFMPFITEELWHALSDPAHPRPYELIVAKWPEPQASVDADAAQAVDWFIDLTSKLRNARNELGLPPGQRLIGHVGEADAGTQANLDRWASALTRIARVDMSADPAPAGATISIVVGEATYIFPLEGIIDVAAEKARLAKALEAATKEAKSLEGRLSNPAFVEKAKPEAVEKARADHAERAAEAERLAAALARLG